MTREEVKKEFNRWVDKKQPAVWVKKRTSNIWSLEITPFWKYYKNEYIYIVDDEQAELRKLQINKPDTKFQYYDSLSNHWFSKSNPKWCINTKYRKKPKEWYKADDAIGKPVYVRVSGESEWCISMFGRYDKENSTFIDIYEIEWKYAKPVKPEDLYQGEEND